MPALLRLLGARRPLLLVLDNLEAADLPSLLLLGSLARGGGGGAAPLLLLAVQRTPVLLETPAAAALNRLSAEQAITKLGLAGLDRAEIGEMIGAMTGRPVDEQVAAAVHARTGGSPLFASELIRLMAAEPAGAPEHAAVSALRSAVPLPWGIRGVIEQRLERLPTDCRRLMQAAAVAGHQVDLDVLAGVSGFETSDVVAALRPAVTSAELVTVAERPRAYAFAHPLIRDCLYEGLTAVTRADLHGRFGDALCARYAGAVDEHLEVIASHYVAALPVGWAPRALELARRAARRAASLGARDECVRLLLLAREALAAIDDGGAIWCELTLELAEAHDRAGQTLEARAAFMHVAARAEAVGLSSEFARAAVGYGGRLIWARPTGDPREIPMLERAYAALGADEAALRALLLARKSILRRDLAGADAILAGCRQAAELARAADDATTRAQVLGALVFALGCLGTTGTAWCDRRAGGERGGERGRRADGPGPGIPRRLPARRRGRRRRRRRAGGVRPARAIPAPARAALAARVFARGGRLLPGPAHGGGEPQRGGASRRPGARATRSRGHLPRIESISCGASRADWRRWRPW